MCSCRCRDWKNTMRTMNLSVTYMNWGGDNLLWCKFINCQANTYDICYGIHCPDFMEMYFLYRASMGVTFCVCD